MRSATVASSMAAALTSGEAGFTMSAATGARRRALVRPSGITANSSCELPKNRTLLADADDPEMDAGDLMVLSTGSHRSEQRSAVPAEQDVTGRPSLDLVGAHQPAALGVEDG
jgi:hypothetical protein